MAREELIPRRTGLLSEPQFWSLLRAKLAIQLAQNMLLYTILIVVVKKTDSSFHSTLLVLAATLPSVVFGIPGGLIADWLPKRASLALVTIVKAAVALALLRYGGDLAGIYVLVLIFSTIGQLQGPAESAGLPGLVGRERLAGANSYLLFATMAAQLAGLVIIAPALLKTVGEEPAYVISGILFLASGLFYFQTDGLDSPPPEPPPEERPATKGLWAGIDVIRSDRQVYLSVVELTLASFLMKSVVVLMPHYARDVLNLSPDNSVFIATPAAAGSLVALALAPLLIWIIGSQRVVTLGLLLFIAALTGLGVVYFAADYVQANLHLNLSGLEDRLGISSVVSMTMLLAVPLGLAFTLMTVGARTVFNRRSPAELQGRVFAAQSALGDLVSVPPLLAVGIVADLVGVRAVLLAVAGASLFAALFVRVRPPASGGRLGPQPASAGG